MNDSDWNRLGELLSEKLQPILNEQKELAENQKEFAVKQKELAVTQKSMAVQLLRLETRVGSFAEANIRNSLERRFGAKFAQAFMMKSLGDVAIYLSENASETGNYVDKRAHVNSLTAKLVEFIHDSPEDVGMSYVCALFRAIALEKDGALSEKMTRAEFLACLRDPPPERMSAKVGSSLEETRAYLKQRKEKFGKEVMGRLGGFTASLERNTWDVCESPGLSVLIFASILAFWKQDEAKGLAAVLRLFGVLSLASLHKELEFDVFGRFDYFKGHCIITVGEIKANCEKLHKAKDQCRLRAAVLSLVAEILAAAYHRETLKSCVVKAMIFYQEGRYGLEQQLDEGLSFYFIKM